MHDGKLSLRRFAPVALAALLLASAACSSTKSARRYSREQAANALGKLEKTGLIIGEFQIDGAGSVVDGDTIKVKGLQSSLRLLCIDTEETFKKETERKAFAQGWEAYKKQMRGQSFRPVKMATPLGEDAKHFAQAFFEGVSKVRLERDHPGEIRDFYGRYLAYVFVQKKDGEWVNYNLEAVRTGMAPYFTKYGFSRRFHQEFVDAQNFARSSGLGIWDPKRQHYDDYDERLPWWDERGATIDRFEKQMDGHPDHLVLTRWDAIRTLEKNLNQEVTVLASLAEIRRGDKGPTIAKLARNRTNALEVVFFDKDVFLTSGLDAKQGEYVVIRGKVTKYKDKKSQRERLQMVVASAGQVVERSAELDKALEDPLDTSGLPPVDVRQVEAQPDPDLDKMQFDTLSPDEVPLSKIRPGAVQGD